MSRMTDDAIRAIISGSECDRDEAIDMAREIQERRAVDAVRRAEIDELVARRNADLSGDELSELSNALACVKTVIPHHCAGRVAAIEKILAAHGVKR